jgi:hypothetical protein
MVKSQLIVRADIKPTTKLLSKPKAISVTKSMVQPKSVKSITNNQDKKHVNKKKDLTTVKTTDIFVGSSSSPTQVTKKGLKN